MSTPKPTRSPTTPPDRGSVTPLIIGMMLCLLLLGAGITAAGSAFLAGQRLQHLCDGAAAAAADTLTGPTSDSVTAGSAVTDYLAVRHSDVAAQIAFDGATVNLTCSADTPITFGALFGAPTLHRTVHAGARTNYTQG